MIHAHSQQKCSEHATSGKASTLRHRMGRHIYNDYAQSRNLLNLAFLNNARFRGKNRQYSHWLDSLQSEIYAIGD